MNTQVMMSYGNVTRAPAIIHTTIELAQSHRPALS